MSDENSNGDRLQPDWGLGAMLDPVSFGDALLALAGALLRNPRASADASARLAAGSLAAGTATTSRLLGGRARAAISPARGDRRFRDPAWEDNPFYFGLRQGYLLWSQFMRDLAATADLDPETQPKAEFAIDAIVDAAAPTNTLIGNPAALKRAYETGGASVVRGLRNFVDDVSTGGGLPAQVDRTQFVLGVDIAATPGKVVFRNRLMELIQYEAQTEDVYAVPLLLSPPWINKYYVMDLAPGRSFAEWAVQQGHTVFAISYRNPGESLRDVGFDDYLLEGPVAAIDAIAEITGSTHVNVAALCLGGTLLGALLGYLEALPKRERAQHAAIRSATLLNSLLDFAEPGPLGAFVDEKTIARLEKRMAERGYLEGSEMHRVFTFLRANDLVWSYVASSWLMGEPPPAFDLLAWNADATRMPARMHSEYLRWCYLENRLANGTMELAGRRIDLGTVSEDAYVVGAEEDHIVPWRSAYRATQLLGGDVRFVLTSAGHVAGIVNPPGTKRSYSTNDDYPADADEWFLRASLHAGSWWEDWAPWVAARAGDRRRAPSIGSEQHPPIEDAPGTYVSEL